MESLGFYIYSIKSSANSKFNFFRSNLNLFLGLQYHDKQRWWEWASLFVPDLRGKFQLFITGYKLALSLSYMAFIMLRYSPSIQLCWEFFLTNRCWIFFKWIFCIYWDDHVIFIFILFMWCITLVIYTYRTIISPLE